MTNANKLIWSIAIVGLGVIGWSGYMNNVVNGEQAQIDKCFEYHRSSLNDPQSAYIVSTRFSVDKTVIEARAKNAFGGFIPISMECTNIEGIFDFMATIELPRLERDRLAKERDDQKKLDAYHRWVNEGRQ